MKFRNRITRLAAVPLASACVVLASPVALAHDSVIGGSVTSGEVLQEFPREITLEFSGIPQEGYNTFAVTDTDTEEVLFDAEPDITGRDLTIEVPEDVNPGPGNYQVGFRITSSDGHSTMGSVPFSVAGAQGATVPTETSNSEAGSSSGSTAELSGGLKTVISIGAILAALAVIIMLVAKMRGTNKKG
ncbi:copper resistance protein [Corynebacterium phocae]|uniref:Copper resistance protein n=1 Tax=Corynebacterium phocae TaxID=161895 RepID=A0A1L7D2T4_9CORY|nr:copper resistance protein CopC [Corynebacterium phocae]APT92410.1 copper resistance protein [Corynebacterium phocae]KAA8725006.1 copper resistance protein CopC [Corynebacterium phocae]